MNEKTKAAELVIFLTKKLVLAEKSLAAREQMESVWKSGTSASWRKVGCGKSKLARMLESSKQGRIADQCRRDVELYRAAIDMIGGTITK